MIKKKILITGGAGFIGSYVNKLLNQNNYDTVILDNLSRGSKKTILNQGTFIQGDIGDSSLLSKIFKEHSIDAVMHFAALINVGESTVDPYSYYENNISQALTLLEEMKKNDILTFIFSSSASIFGIPKTKKITESHPTTPINPYGKTKLITENILEDFDHAYGIKSCCLRYFNAAGGDPDNQIKNYNSQELNLIPIILRNLLSSDSSVTVFGNDYATPDGTCIRDYIHIHDLAEAHILALNHLFKTKTSSQYNLGNENGYSVNEVIQTIKEITKSPIKIVHGPRRPGDPPFLIADSNKAQQELGWQTKYPDLQSMVKHAWKAMQEEQQASNNFF